MNKNLTKSRVLRWVLALLIAAAGICALALSGRYLVVNQPRKSDVIVVLAGETDVRPACGLQLLHENYASRMLLNVPADARVYQWSQAELAEKYVQGLPESKSIKSCPIHGFSTKAEAADVVRCLQPLNARKVLLETSDYHTRRALSIFATVDKTRQYSVFSCSEPRSFGINWWQQREWAKTDLYEWMRLIWWQMVDRWR